MQTTYFATAPAGMVDLLATELEQFGATGIAAGRAGATFSADLEIAYRACLWSRIANRILLPIASFPADSTDALYQGALAVDWQRHIPGEGTLAVDANVSRSAIDHSQYAALRIKDAIVDQFRSAAGTRPSVDVEHPDVRINAWIHQDQVELAIDLSGASLHRRGYRIESGEAPLKENLAAAILLRAGWPELAGEGAAFADVMCGAGTLVIEAALMAADIAPGLNRNYFGFTGWRGHHRGIWQRLLAEAAHRRDKGLERLPPLLGFDHDRGVLEKARDNATRAGVADKVAFARQDITDFRQDLPARGLLVTNPPYGRRLMETGELPSLYRALGEVMRADFRHWRAAVFTEDPELGKEIGIRARRLHTLYNGAIACRLIHFDIEEREFFRHDRLPARLDESELTPQAGEFRNRLQKNIKQLRRWLRREGIFCYRLYDADLPDYAVAIDVYSHADSPDQPWACVQEYEAPADIDPRKAKRRIREIRTVLQEVLEVEDDRLFFKVRARQRRDAQYQPLAETGHFHRVTEGGCEFWVNFEDHLDTGLFLDHRPIRERIGNEAKDARFLNLFAYTGAATVHAAAGGARSTTTVDMSKTYLDWARRNLELNEFDMKSHSLIREDCLAWLAAADPRRQQWDLIFLDPPTFSNSKRMEGSFDIQRDHVALVQSAAALLAPGGALYFSTNLRTFRLDESLQQTFGIEDITSQTIPPDYKRRQNIHRCFRITQR